MKKFPIFVLFATIGSITRNIFLKTQSHKLSHDFIAAGTIRQGALVKIGTDGTITEAGTSDSEDLIMGVAFHGGITGDRVTVICRGYVILTELANASQNAGPVVQGAWNATIGAFRYSAGTAGTDPVHGWALDAATAQDQDIRVLVKG